MGLDFLSAKPGLYANLTRCTWNCTHTRHLKSWQELKERVGNYILDFCLSSKQLRILHAYAISLGIQRSAYISSLLVSKYSSFRDLESAHRVFHHHSPEPTKTLLWNSLMRACCQNQQPRLVLDLYHQMMLQVSQCPADNQTFNIVITACNDLLEYELGIQVHFHARSVGLEFDTLVGTALVSMYCRAGDLKTAQQIFDGMSKRDVVSWNALFNGYASLGSIQKVMTLFRIMKSEYGILPTGATFVSILSTCDNLGSIYSGKSIHAYLTKFGLANDQFVCNSLLEMYIKCRNVNCAFKVFNAIEVKDAISWSTMIGGLVRNGCPSYAVQLFNQMVSTEHVEPTRPILLNVILASAALKDLQRGREIHEKYIKGSSVTLEPNECLITVLIYMYTKCGRMEMALKLLSYIFGEENKVIAWNTAMKACVELGRVGWALKIFLEMLWWGTNPDSITFLTLLPLFSSLSLLREGMQAHSHIIKRGFVSRRSVANSLIEMYGKCGLIKESFEMFAEIPDKDVISWSLIIKGFAWSGDGAKAVALFGLMRETGVEPNHITFIAVLSACSHAGYVNKGRELYNSMVEDYRLNPTVEHICCMVDLFCRAGLLLEAYQLIANTEMDENSSIALWGALLSACRFKCDWLIGEAAAKFLFLLEPRNPSNYVMLAHIYMEAGLREKANTILKLMRDKVLKGVHGCSWLPG